MKQFGVPDFSFQLAFTSKLFCAWTFPDLNLPCLPFPDLPSHTEEPAHLRKVGKVVGNEWKEDTPLAGWAAKLVEGQLGNLVPLLGGMVSWGWKCPNPIPWWSTFWEKEKTSQKGKWPPALGPCYYQWWEVFWPADDDTFSLLVL